MARILLFVKNPEDLTPPLKLAGHEVHVAPDGAIGVEMAKRLKPEVAIIDGDLSVGSGLEVLTNLNSAGGRTVCVLLTGHWSLQQEFDAIALGAAACLRTPLTSDEVTEMVKRALASRARRPYQLGESPSTLQPIKPHALTRLAELSVLFIASREDKATLRLLGREVGHAAGCLRNWCRVAGVKARAFREFTRALRAVYRLTAEPSTATSNVLEIVDVRTLERFRIRCGGTAKQLPATVDEFLEKQLFIQHPEFIAAVRVVLLSIKS